jgi:hypothetical protein
VFSVLIPSFSFDFAFDSPSNPLLVPMTSPSASMLSRLGSVMGAFALTDAVSCANSPSMKFTRLVAKPASAEEVAKLSLRTLESSLSFPAATALARHRLASLAYDIALDMTA